MKIEKKKKKGKKQRKKINVFTNVHFQTQHVLITVL